MLFIDLCLTNTDRPVLPSTFIKKEAVFSVCSKKEYSRGASLEGKQHFVILFIAGFMYLFVFGTNINAQRLCAKS